MKQTMNKKKRVHIKSGNYCEEERKGWDCNFEFITSSLQYLYERALTIEVNWILKYMVSTLINFIYFFLSEYFL